MNSRQKEIFEQIHQEYYASTGDHYAHAYKEHYVFTHVEKYLGDAKTVMELACGKGEASGWLRDRNRSLQISGCDISEPAAADFMSIHKRPCFVADLTKPFSHPDKYDAVIVMGGVHHLVSDLEVAFTNISNLLVPGGRLIMAEPNASYALNLIRRIWYRLDKSNFDSDTERALYHDKIFGEYGKGFRKIDVRYFGGPAYFLLALNMFLRVPNRTKRVTAPILMKIERAFNMLPTKYPFASFIACWERV